MHLHGIVVLSLLLAALSAAPSWAAEHSGQVTLGGVPVPGVKVTASQGDQKVTTSTNQDGTYRFPSLAEGTWAVRVEMLGFSPVTREIAVTAGKEP